MTLQEAIERFDLLYPNAMPLSAKRDALSAFDGKLFSQVLAQYRDAPERFDGYTETTPGNVRLLAQFPFDDLYIKLLCAEYAAVSGDTARYNNASALFNESYENYVNYLNRTRARKGEARRLRTEGRV